MTTNAWKAEVLRERLPIPNATNAQHLADWLNHPTGNPFTTALSEFEEQWQYKAIQTELQNAYEALETAMTEIGDCDPLTGEVDLVARPLYEKLQQIAQSPAAEPWDTAPEDVKTPWRTFAQEVIQGWRDRVAALEDECGRALEQVTRLTQAVNRLAEGQMRLQGEPRRWNTPAEPPAH